MVCVFARTITDDLAGLVKQVDDVVGKNGDKKMAAFLVLLTDDADKDEERLVKLAADRGIARTPLTTFGGAAGPPAYKVPEKADVTVLMWVKGKFTVKHAFEKGKLDAASVKSVVEDTAKILE